MTFRFLLETPPLPPPGGPVKRRLAVRALILRSGRLLMVQSASVGDWKFPGGGVEARETPEQALEREIAEETGFRSLGRFRRAGTVVERAPGRDLKGSLFEMESRYFWAEVHPTPGRQKLDAYERRLGFTPSWVAAEEALAANRAVAAAGGAVPSWLERESRVLAWLAQGVSDGSDVQR